MAVTAKGVRINKMRIIVDTMDFYLFFEVDYIIHKNDKLSIYCKYNSWNSHSHAHSHSRSFIYGVKGIDLWMVREFRAPIP